ncbi:hypothetical protein QIW52_17935 [Clostridioides difficile]|nr:hypothetical protein [Clostridioides difficile]
MSEINKKEINDKKIHFYGEEISIPARLWFYFNKWLETSKNKIRRD